MSQAESTTTGSTDTEGKKNPTTADSWNRQRDRVRIESTFGLPEFTDHRKVYRFYSLGEVGELVACGYQRVVYGDHGPYIECTKEQVHWPSLKLNEHKAETAPQRYYDEWFTADRTVMIYDQKRDVGGKRNPPQDGKVGVAMRNRAEGYADYRVGMCYLDPEQIRVTITGTEESPGPGTAEPQQQQGPQSRTTEAVMPSTTGTGEEGRGGDSTPAGSQGSKKKKKSRLQ